MGTAVAPRADEASHGPHALCDRCALVVRAAGGPVVCEPCALAVRPSQLPEAPRAPGWWWVDAALAHESHGDGSVLVARGSELFRYAATPAGLLLLGAWM